MSTERTSKGTKDRKNLYYIVGAVVAALVVAGVLIGVSLFERRWQRDGRLRDAG